MNLSHFKEQQTIVCLFVDLMFLFFIFIFGCVYERYVCVNEQCSLNIDDADDDDDDDVIVFIEVLLFK